MLDSENARALRLPEHDGLFYGGAWHAPIEGTYDDVSSPVNGKRLGRVARGSPADVDAAVRSAREGFVTWCDTLPLERARILRSVGAILRAHAEELALLDAIDCGNPVA